MCISINTHKCACITRCVCLSCIDFLVSMAKLRWQGEYHKSFLYKYLWAYGINHLGSSRNSKFSWVSGVYRYPSGERWSSVAWEISEGKFKSTPKAVRILSGRLFPSFRIRKRVYVHCVLCKRIKIQREDHSSLLA